MHTYKRSVILQLGVFGFFFLYGIDNIIKSLLAPSMAFSIIELVVLLLVLGAGIYFYFTTPKDIVYVVNKSDIDKIKYSLYAISVGLIASIFSSGLGVDSSLYQYINIATGSVIALVGLLGVYVGVKIFKNNQ